MFVLPEQIVVLPEMVPGCVGPAFTVTDKVCTAELPQALLATTVMLPPVEPAVVEIELVVLLPDQPLGKVQV